MFESLKKIDSAEITELLHVAMGPRDVLIFKIAGSPSNEMLERIKTGFEKTLGADRKVLVIGDGFTFIGVIEVKDAPA